MKNNKTPKAIIFSLMLAFDMFTSCDDDVGSDKNTANKPPAPPNAEDMETFTTDG